MNLQWNKALKLIIQLLLLFVGGVYAVFFLILLYNNPIWNYFEFIIGNIIMYLVYILVPFL